jgi:hypothetical protein
MDHAYLSYSGRKCYLTCPKQYKYKYIDRLEAYYNPENVMFGSVIGKIFELFYVRRLWLSNDVVRETMSIIQQVTDMTAKEKNFDLSAHPRFSRELKEDLEKFVPAGVQIIKKHKLLFPDSRAEVKLNIMHRMHGLDFMLGGRADFIHRDNDRIWILDGKGSKYREQYIDIEQVIWYAVQFYLKFHVAPIRLGFIHWRFPDDPMQWIMFDADSFRASLDKTYRTIQKIRDREFDPKPSEECSRCSYNDICMEGKQYMAAHPVKSKVRIENSIFGLESLNSSVFIKS